MSTIERDGRLFEVLFCPIHRIKLSDLKEWKHHLKDCHKKDWSSKIPDLYNSKKKVKGKRWTDMQPHKTWGRKKRQINDD